VESGWWPPALAGLAGWSRRHVPLELRGAPPEVLGAPRRAEREWEEGPPLEGVAPRRDSSHRAGSDEACGTGCRCKKARAEA
jgi:hypothetical protein